MNKETITGQYGAINVRDPAQLAIIRAQLVEFIQELRGRAETEERGFTSVADARAAGFESNDAMDKALKETSSPDFPF